MTVDVTFELNGVPVTLAVEPHCTLREALRRLGMFSVHYGSESGETGAAAVLYDGRLASADVILAASADGHRVTTVESLNVSPELHPIQTAFVAVGAFQSGYSAGAMILGTLALLEENPDPSEDDIRDMFSGILDRETAYAKQEMPIEDIVAHLAIATRRPMRLELDRAEEFYASRTRHPQTITFRTAGPCPRPWRPTTCWSSSSCAPAPAVLHDETPRIGQESRTESEGPRPERQAEAVTLLRRLAEAVDAGVAVASATVVDT